MNLMSRGPLVALLLLSCKQAAVVPDDARAPSRDAIVDAVELDLPDASDFTDASAPMDLVDVVDAGPPPDRVVTSCSEVVVAGAASSGVPAIEGWPLLVGEARGADLVFRAPAVARPTRLSVGTLVIQVDPRGGPSFDVPGLAADCGPFQHGVASGDPRPDGVTLWTRWTPTGATASAEVQWVIATDSALRTVIRRGTATARPDVDWTVHVDASGLSPSTTYYYRFTAPDGEVSALGRTRTAAAGAASHLRFAVASCSSLYSGWFNAYRRIAERRDLDAMIHLGDYIYDFVDEQERVRVPPSGTVEDLTDVASHRRRHAQYLSDPDLRLARQAHPWIMLWDNHDLSRTPPEYGGGVQAYREWNALPALDAGQPRDRLYRTVRYGDLVDLVVVDATLFEDRDPLPGDAGRSRLGTVQYDWLMSGLRRSRATWRLLATQKVFTEFSAFSGWQGHEAARSQLIGFLRDERIQDNVFLVGDSHFTIFQDVVDNPLNAASPYDPTNGRGAVGAEFLPTSITRGNFDEQLGSAAASSIPGVRTSFLRRNPHQVDLELASHGYGIVDLTPERVVTEVWYSPIPGPADAETFGGGYAIPRGANRYARTRLATPTAGR